MEALKQTRYPFTQPLNVPIGKRLYRLEADYNYYWQVAGVWHRITVPKGYKNDGASIPRLLWSFSNLTPDGLIRAAAEVHDWIYGHKGVIPFESHQYEMGDRFLPVRKTWKRKEADDLFLHIMKQSGIGKTDRKRAYIAVRWFGWLSWRK